MSVMVEQPRFLCDAALMPTASALRLLLKLVLKYINILGKITHILFMGKAIFLCLFMVW